MTVAESPFEVTVAYAVGGRAVASWSEKGHTTIWEIKCAVALKIDASPNRIMLMSGPAALDNSQTLELSGLPRKMCLSMLLRPATLALSGAQSGEVKLWDIDGAVCKLTIQAHDGNVKALAADIHGKVAVSGGEDGTIRLWDLSSGECLQNFKGHGKAIWSLVVDWHGKRIFSGALDEQIKLWHFESNESTLTIPGGAGNVMSLAVEWDLELVLATFSNGSMKLWQLPSLVPIRTFKGHTRHVTVVAANWAGSEALSGSLDCRAKLWDLSTGDCVRTFVVRPLTRRGDSVCSVAGDWLKRLAYTFSSRECSVKVWHLDDGSCLRTLEAAGHPISAVMMRSDCSSALVGFSDRKLRIWDLLVVADDEEEGPITPVELQVLEGHCGPVLTIAA
eukprot:TRINITY_DN40245_c0_g1_i1.p1 TRINITY_DN40245_c0_g1~~TRINITY_DN40245_c0_g1_i1.p1  ORF type:complete len:391 (-),score=36.47 TRINITY_DN40245_c0_g1_i1:159-1331(-)